MHHLQQQLQQATDTIEQLRDQQTQDRFKLDQNDRQLLEAEESVVRLQEQMGNVQLQQQVTRDEPELSQIQQQLQQHKEIQQQLQQVKETVTKLQQKRTKGRSIFRNMKLQLLLALLMVVILLPVAKYYFGALIVHPHRTKMSNKLLESLAFATCLLVNAI